MRQNLTRIILLSTIALACAGCGGPSSDEVAVVPSPDGRLEAVLIETNGGATTSFGYEVSIREKNARAMVVAATLYGAIRNPQAYGVNMSWPDDHTLRIEYLSAKDQFAQKVIPLHGGIAIQMRAGILDPKAPAGGMLFNLEKQRR
jgi:hypothetical protein